VRGIPSCLFEIVLLVLLLAGCGQGNSPDASPAGTGTATARVLMSQADAGSSFAEVTVWVGVFDGAGIDCGSFDPGPPRPALVQAVFSAAQGGGVVHGIPGGLDRIFLVQGLNRSGEVISRGCAEGITIIPGTNTVVQEPIRLAPTYPAPEIGSITPAYAFPGTEVRISGQNFSSLPAENRVFFPGAEAEILGASATEILTRVPVESVSGKVTVRLGRQVSAGQAFTVVEAEIPYERAYALGITPDGKNLYVSRRTVGPTESGIVSIIDADPLSPSYNTVVAPEIARSSRYTVDQIKLTPDGTLAYCPAAYETLVIDTDPRSRTCNTVIDAFGFPWGGPLYNPTDLVLTPDSQRAYICFNETGDIGVFDTDRWGGHFDELIARISLGDDPRLTWPEWMAITPDGKRVFSSLLTERRVITVQSDPLKQDYNTVTARADMGLQPAGIGVTGDGRWLCAADGLTDSLVVAAADTPDAAEKTLAIAATVRVGTSPFLVVPAPGDRFVFVAGTDSRLAAVNTEAPDPSGWFCENLLPLPQEQVNRMVVTPDQSRAYISFSDGGVLGIRIGIPQPVLTALSPLTGDEESLLTLSGHGFSPVLSENRVIFRGAEAEPVELLPEGLTVRVPRGAASGTVRVQTGQGRSNSLFFSVTPLDAARLPVAEFLTYVDTAPSGRYAFADQAPIPAEDPHGFLIDIDPASETFQSVLWEGLLSSIASRTCRFSPDSRKIYVSVDNDLLGVVDLGTKQPPEPSFRVLSDLHMTGIDFDAERGLAYVCDSVENTLYRLDLRSDRPVGAPLPIGQAGKEKPWVVCVDPVSGNDIYVLARNSSDVDRVYRIARASWTVLSSAPAGVNCTSMVISQDGSYLFLTEETSGTVRVLDTAAMSDIEEGNETAAVIPVGVKPQKLCMAPDRYRLYAVNTGSSSLSIIDTDPESPTRFHNLQDYPTLPGPSDLAITPDGSRAYVVSRLDRNGEVQVILLHEIP
jgi:DNA-binding beta-propeller fold protein YncE